MFVGLTCFPFSVQQWKLEATGTCEGEGRIQSAENGR